MKILTNLAATAEDPSESVPQTEFHVRQHKIVTVYSKSGEPIETDMRLCDEGLIMGRGTDLLFIPRAELDALVKLHASEIFQPATIVKSKSSFIADMLAAGKKNAKAPAHPAPGNGPAPASGNQAH